ncbi:MAG: DUF488 family protein [Chloroflexi bacterium]|nr:DUF488 family protein [Chloroflexota bacterium]
MLRVKRVYEGKQADDGTRLLVDRLWPRGLSKGEAGIDEWLKDLAPSDELRRWFAHEPEKWPEFRKRYLEELSVPEKTEALKRIARMVAEGGVTLLYAAKDTERNNARVLADVVTGFRENSQRKGGR